MHRPTSLVAAWWEVKEAAAEAPRELRAAEEEGAAEARATGEANVARLQQLWGSG